MKFGSLDRPSEVRGGSFIRKERAIRKYLSFGSIVKITVFSWQRRRQLGEPGKEGSSEKATSPKKQGMVIRVLPGVYFPKASSGKQLFR